MSQLNYQRSYWQNFITNSSEDRLASDLNSSWDASSKKYLSHTEIPEEYLAYLKENIEFKKTLDFGVGLGRNQPYLKSLFSEVHGFDLPEMIQRYSKIVPENKNLFHDFNILASDYSLLYESTVFQHMPPNEVLFYLIFLSKKSKYYFTSTRSYNDFLRRFNSKNGGINMYHLIMSSNSWEKVFISNDKADYLNNETYYCALYKSKNLT